MKSDDWEGGGILGVRTDQHSAHNNHEYDGNLAISFQSCNEGDDQNPVGKEVREEGTLEMTRM